jgi:ankyrin repeat protein
MSALHQTLSSLPSTLDETYARILDKIEDKDKRRALHLLQFICYGVRPIRVKEASMLWLVGDNGVGPICVDDILFDPANIVDFFGGLVSIVSINVRRFSINYSTWDFLNRGGGDLGLSVLQLTHFSVKEYLFSLQAGFWALAEESSHLSIVQYSIAYYLYAVAVDAMSPLPPGELLEKHSLADYCCRYIFDHLDHLTPRNHPALTSAFHHLLHPDSNQIANRFGATFFFLQYWRWKDIKNMPLPDNNPLALILAARLGLSEVAAWLLTFDTVQEQIDAFVPDFKCGPPILEAAAKGHTDVIRLLLKNGANINQEGDYWGNALFVASRNGQETAVQMLIEAGACINNEDKGGMTPIQVASEKGHKGIVEMLIKAGADVNSGSEPPLSCASGYGNEDVVQTLILAGANVNLEGGLETALHAASRWYYPGRKILELLIDAGADVNQVAGRYGTALQAAVAGDMDEPSALEAVRILIGAGANVNLVGGKYGTALQAAAYYNGHKIIEELIDAGANVNLVGGEYGTALRAAVLSESYSLEDRIDVLQMLIQAGADVNLKRWKDTSPLEAALARGHPDIAQILLDAGAKPQKRPLLSLPDSDTDEREGKRPRICNCTVTDAECDCAKPTW